MLVKAQRLSQPLSAGNSQQRVSALKLSQCPLKYSHRFLAQESITRATCAEPIRFLHATARMAASLDDCQVLRVQEARGATAARLMVRAEKAEDTPLQLTRHHALASSVTPGSHIHMTNVMLAYGIQSESRPFKPEVP